MRLHPRNMEGITRMANKSELFSEDAVFVCDRTDQTEVFTEVANQLLLKDYVTSDFLKNIVEREAGYPTGMDMSPVDPELPNFAVPHTEVEFVNVKRIVPVKLVHPVKWHNMIDPTQEMEVSFLFMILNDSKEAQVGILAQIMDFVNGLGAEGAKKLFSMTDTHEIYQFLVDNFPA